LWNESTTVTGPVANCAYNLVDIMCRHQNPMSNVYNIVTQGWLKVQYMLGGQSSNKTAPGSRCYNAIVVFSK